MCKHISLLTVFRFCTIEKWQGCRRFEWGSQSNVWWRKGRSAFWICRIWFKQRWYVGMRKIPTTLIYILICVQMYACAIARVKASTYNRLANIKMYSPKNEINTSSFVKVKMIILFKMPSIGIIFFNKIYIKKEKNSSQLCNNCFIFFF